MNKDKIIKILKEWADKVDRGSPIFYEMEDEIKLYAAIQESIKALKERDRFRWHKWPEEKPDSNGCYRVVFYDQLEFLPHDSFYSKAYTETDYKDGKWGEIYHEPHSELEGCPDEEVFEEFDESDGIVVAWQRIEFYSHFTEEFDKEVEKGLVENE